jgi:hypothetical protein
MVREFSYYVLLLLLLLLFFNLLAFFSTYFCVYKSIKRKKFLACYARNTYPAKGIALVKKRIIAASAPLFCEL